MKLKFNKLTAGTLALLLILSSITYPVYATDDINNEISEVSTQVTPPEEVEDETMPTDNVEPQAEVEPDDVVESPADDNSTINLADDNISSNVPKLDDLASDESQLVIPQGEDEHDNTTFSGITPYSTNVGGFTVTGGTQGVDFDFLNGQELTIKTATPLRIYNNDSYSFERISIHADSANITLCNVRLDAVSNAITVNGYNITINVEGTVKLSGNMRALRLSQNTTIKGVPGSLLEIVRWNPIYVGIDALMPRYLHLIDVELKIPQPANGFLRNVRLVQQGTLIINGVNISSGVNPLPDVAQGIVSANQLSVLTANYVHGVFGRTLYSLNGVDWLDNGGTFTNLESDTTYNVHVKYEAANGLQESPVATYPVTTNHATYEVTIPSGFNINDDVAPKNITIKSETLDLGHNGQVDVKIVGGSIQDNGRLQLSHLDTGDVIRSQLYVNSQLFQVRVGDVRQSVATFTMTDKDPVPISFAPPDETNIVPGTYEGTVVFGISYSD